MAKNLISGVALAACMAFALPVQLSAETLAGALTSAYNNSNLLEQSRAILRAEDEDVAIALSALLPQINGSASVTVRDNEVIDATTTSTIGVSLELLLWDFGRTELLVESAKETVLAVRADLVQQEQQTLLDAVNSYVQVLRDQRVVQLRQSNLRLITQELRAARDRFEVGEVTRTDVAQAEARLAQARGSLAESQGQLQITRELYKIAIGHAPSNLKSISRLPKLPKSLATAQGIALRSSPSIDKLQHQIKANEINYSAAKAGIRPRITANAGVSHSSSTTGSGSSIGLAMTVPIYQGGQISALVRKSLAGVHASKAALSQTILVVKQGVANSWSRLAVANAQVLAADRQIRAAQIAFDGVREETKLGARTTLDVLDAEQALSDARTNRVVSETQVYSASYSLLSSMGKLTADDLNLKVKRYDPAEYYNAVKNAPVPSSKSGKKLNRILNRYQKN